MRNSLLEIVTQDRPGLLHTISGRLSDEGCSIEVALIDTEGPLAHDVFYLTRDGQKLNGEQMRDLEWALAGELSDSLPTGKGQRRGPLFKFHDNLVDLDAIALRDSDVLDLAGHRRGDVGLHLHGFQHHHQVIGLKRLPRLHVQLHYNSGDRTAADLGLVYVLRAAGAPAAGEARLLAVQW